MADKFAYKIKNPRYTFCPSGIQLSSDIRHLSLQLTF